MKTHEELKADYKKFISYAKKNQHLICVDLSRFENESKLHLLQSELKNVYGLDFNEKIRSLTWQEIKPYRYYVNWQEEMRISWSDDGIQPNLGERMIEISFPTVAYIFGDSYPIEIFQEFYRELQSYKPKYQDTANSSLYFELGKSKEVFNSFDDIFRKYKDKVSEYNNQKRIKELEDELKRLK